MEDNKKSKQVFLRVKRVVKAEPNQTLLLRNLAEVVSSKEIQEKLEQIKIKEVIKPTGQSMIITALEIIRAIKDEYPEIKIEHLGEADVVVDIEENPSKQVINNPSSIYIFAVGLILFLGSGMAIMNFHADVNMLKVHQQLYYLITGEFKKNPLLLQIPYSLGIACGMIIFFNQIYKYKFNDDPNPLEIEMYLYENKVNQFSLHQKAKQAKKEGRNK